MRVKSILLSILAAFLVIFSMNTQSFAASSSVSSQHLKVIEKVTTTTNAHIRTGAGKHYRSVGIAKKGKVLSVVGTTKNHWVRIAWGNSYRYVYSKWVKKVAAPAPKKTAVAPVVKKPAAPKLESSMVLATTTSTQDSGLLDTIIPMFEAKYNVDVKVVAVGTGAALQMGRDGDADVVLVHDRPNEDLFVKQGYGTDAWNVMYNQFVVVGPSNDPAHIKGSKSAADAFKKIYNSKATFISRADKSGTNSKELAIWKLAGLNPDGADWYKKAGLGMGDTLRMADETGAYTLSDEATFLTNKTGLVKLVYGQSDLFNPYGVILVKNTKKPNVSKTFINWLVSKDTQAVIGKYGKLKYSKPLFVPNASKR